MQQLPSQFLGRGEVRGFSFRCLEKHLKKAYLYEVYLQDNALPAYYEVFKHVENHRFDRVAYPGSNSFGVWAWTYSNKESAYKKYQEIINKTSENDKQS